MTVPLSEDVASRVPVELSCRHERGDLWAWMMFVTDGVSASKTMTSPADWCELGSGAAEGTLLEKGEDGEGSGEGYARYEFSDDGAREHIAASRAERSCQSEISQQSVALLSPGRDDHCSPCGFGLVSIVWSSFMLDMS